MKTNKIKKTMDERVAATRWSETNTENVLRKIITDVLQGKVEGHKGIEPRGRIQVMDVQLFRKVQIPEIVLSGEEQVHLKTVIVHVPHQVNCRLLNAADIKIVLKERNFLFHVCLVSP